jgi:hypothetical protein
MRRRRRTPARRQKNLRRRRNQPTRSRLNKNGRTSAGWAPLM